ncbi:hypothetical protein RUND412_001240 [Rhizina undulata]
MAGLLRRSKSTRDARPTKIPRDQLDFAFENEILRSQTPQPNSGSAAAVLTKLTRRQSFSNTHDPPPMSSAGDRSPPKTSHSNKRGSIFVRREHPAPPPFKLSMFPPVSRPTSKQSNREHPPPLQRPAASGELLAPEVFIGIALGSPSEAAQKQTVETDSASQDAQSLQNEIAVFSLPPGPFGVEVKGPMVKEARKEAKQKGKGSKHEDHVKGWKKLFGRGIFGKKSSKLQSQGPYQPGQEQLHAPPLPRADEPLQVMVLETQPEPHLVPKAEVPPERVEVKLSPAPCIDVNIPEFEMERYSVMFGTLLQPSDKSSLYARRRLKESGSAEALAQPEIYLTPLKRNATTGQVCRSPLSMLGDSLRQASRSPNSSPGRSSSASRSQNRMSYGLSRSKSATASPPPSPRKYMVGKLPEGSVSSPQLARRGDDAGGIEAPELRPRSSSQSSQVSRISEESAHSVNVDTPRGSFDEGDDEWLTRVDEGEPQWEMVTGRAASIASSFDSEMESEADPEGGAGEKGNEFEAIEKAVEVDDLVQAAQISIARQISVSQRQLLLPVVPKSQRLVSRAALKGPLSPRIVEKPSVVIPQSHNVEYGNAQ